MVTMSTSTSTQIPNHKASNNEKDKKSRHASAVNNIVNKLILDRGSCEKLHKKFRFADPVFITSGIHIINTKANQSAHALRAN